MRHLALLLLWAFCLGNPSAAIAEFNSLNWWDDSPWGDPDRGFNWYPDPASTPKPVEDETDPEKPRTIFEMTTLEEIRAELDRLKGVAVINPTEQNVLDYLRAQNFVMDKAALFADVSRRVVWANPEVNYAVRSPTVNYARDQAKTRIDKQREENIQRLSETHAIVFFARGDCDFCHDQASILKAFTNRNGMPVLAISLDGLPLPMFPDAKPDNGISMLASEGEGIQVVPSLFLIDRETQQMIPLGAGVIAGEELSERIRVLTMTTPGQEF